MLDIGADLIGGANYESLKAKHLELPLHVFSLCHAHTHSFSLNKMGNITQLIGNENINKQ